MAQVYYRGAVMDIWGEAKGPEGGFKKSAVELKPGFKRVFAKCVKAGSYIKEGDGLIIDVKESLLG